MVDVVWFNTLYAEQYDRLKKMAWRSLDSEAIAEELVQEAFLIMICKLDKLRSHPNLAGWLAVTVQNLIKNELSRASTTREVSMTQEPLDERTMEEYRLEEILPPGLSEEEREVLILYFDKQYTYGQMSEKLGIPEGACRTRLYRAKGHVKKIMLKNKNSCDKMTSWTNIWVRR